MTIPIAVHTCARVYVYVGIAEQRLYKTLECTRRTDAAAV